MSKIFPIWHSHVISLGLQCSNISNKLYSTILIGFGHQMMGLCLWDVIFPKLDAFNQIQGYVHMDACSWVIFVPFKCQLKPLYTRRAINIQVNSAYASMYASQNLIFCVVVLIVHEGAWWFMAKHEIYLSFLVVWEWDFTNLNYIVNVIDFPHDCLCIFYFKN